MSEEILPCPFCGEEPLIYEIGSVFRVMCRNVDCGIYTATNGLRTKEEAIKAWNARAERTCTFSKHNNDKDPYPTCSACGYETDWHECEWLSDNVFEYEKNFCPNCGAKVAQH